MGFEAEIWAWRLREKEEKEEKVKIPLCESIGHLPLRGAALLPPSITIMTYLSRAWVQRTT